MDPDVIWPVHLVALAEHERAENAVAAACELASAHVRERWADPQVWQRLRGEPAYGTGYWEVHPPAPRRAPTATWAGMWFEWTLKQRDLCLGESRGGVPVFFVGLCTDRDTRIIVGDDGVSWSTSLSASHGFMLIHDDEDRHERFVRVAYPEQVLVGDSLQAQGEYLGAWIVESYVALVAAGSPPA